MYELKEDQIGAGCFGNTHRVSPHSRDGFARKAEPCGMRVSPAPHVALIHPPEEERKLRRLMNAEEE